MLINPLKKIKTSVHSDIKMNRRLICSIYIKAALCSELKGKSKTSVPLSCYKKTLLSTITEPREEHPGLTEGVKAGTEFHNSCGKTVIQEAESVDVRGAFWIYTMNG